MREKWWQDATINAGSTYLASLGFLHPTNCLPHEVETSSWALRGISGERASYVGPFVLPPALSSKSKGCYRVVVAFPNGAT